MEELIEAQKQVDIGNLNVIDFNKMSVHTVAGLLKKFLRDLKTPLVPQELYEALIDTQVSNSYSRVN
jgi:hypothetical protein